MIRLISRILPSAGRSFVRKSGTRGRGSEPEAGGFTMIEVLTVAVVVSTLARMAVPGFHEVLLKSRAAGVAGDFDVIRLAAAHYQADHFAWPADAYTGQIPGGLEAYLPEGFDFVGPGYRLDWENWILPDGLPKYPDTGVLVGISLVTDDRELGQAVQKFFGTAMAGYTLGNRYTFIVERN